jgi:putative ABC transport system permease protein
MNAVITKVLGDLRRRRLQAAVIAIVIFLASGTTTLGLTLLQTSSDPWERAFKAQRGAHLSVLFDRHKVDAEQLAATPGLIGASQAGGPWPSVETSYELGAHMAIGGGGFKFPLITVGRESPQADVEVLRLVAGRWVNEPGEIVITRSFANLNHVRLGDRMLSLGTLGRPALVVVGEASDVDEADSEFGTQFAWVTESQLPLLAPDWGYKMVYRFPYAPSQQELRDKLARLQTALPAGAVQASLDYLLLQKVFNGTNQIALTFFLAFGIFALLACAATVANLVIGIVIANYREIGIMKAVGFTPLQVVGTLVVQMQLPTLAGCLFGIPAGVALSVPLVDRETASLALPPEPPFAPVMALTTLLAVLTVVLLATVVPGLRAGRLSAVGAISMATAPSAGRRSWLGAMLRRLPLSRPLALGAGDAFARPLRAGLTALAVLVGVATLVFATGLPASARTLVDIAFAHRSTDVILQRANAYPDDKVMATLGAQPETALVVGLAGGQVIVPGVADPITVNAYRGDSARLGIPIIRGRWFSGPGEVVATRAVLEDTHLKVGDSFHGLISGQPVRLQVVGEVFNANNTAALLRPTALGREMEMDLSTLAEAVPEAQPIYYFVTIKPGSDANAYIRRVQATEPDFLDASANRDQTVSGIGFLNSVMLVLAAVLALIAAAGVFNTLLLNTRERARDTAVLKALGMTPFQVLAMVAAGAVVLGVAGGLLGIPAGVGVHRAMMQGFANLLGSDMPESVFRVFSAPGLLLLALAGVAVALLGSLLPARWAARTRVAEVLHSE